MMPKIILGGIALGAIGYGVKKWIQTEDESKHDIEGHDKHAEDMLLGTQGFYESSYSKVSCQKDSYKKDFCAQSHTKIQSNAHESSTQGQIMQADSQNIRHWQQEHESAKRTQQD